MHLANVPGALGIVGSPRSSIESLPPRACPSRGDRGPTESVDLPARNKFMPKSLFQQRKANGPVLQVEASLLPDVSWAVRFPARRPVHVRATVCPLAALPSPNPRPHPGAAAAPARVHLNRFGPRARGDRLGA